MSSDNPENSKTDELSEKHEQFCREYLVDLNGTRAYLRVYPKSSESAARSSAADLLAKPSVKRRIEELTGERAKRTQITADLVLAEILKIATADLGQAYDEQGNLKPIHDIPIEVRRAMAGVKVFEEFEGSGRERHKVGEVREVRFWDKPRALELLGRHLKLFTDKVEHSGKVEVQSIADDELDSRLAELLSKAGQK